MRRYVRWSLGALGALLVCAGVAHYSWIAYLRWFEQRTPSTVQAVVLRDGRHITLEQPSPALPIPTTRVAAGSTPTALPEPLVLPPERLHIPKINLDWPVVLSDNDHLPQFQGVGWMLGSAFPGAPGNMVLFGHLGGPNGVFQRLHELAPGDEFAVGTQRGEQHYRVQSTHETTPDDVSVLLPGDQAIATLITCSGPWNAALQTNERRLIVTARLIQQP